MDPKEALQQIVGKTPSERLLIRDKVYILSVRITFTDGSVLEMNGEHKEQPLVTITKVLGNQRRFFVDNKAEITEALYLPYENTNRITNESEPGAVVAITSQKEPYLIYVFENIPSVIYYPSGNYDFENT